MVVLMWVSHSLFPAKASFGLLCRLRSFGLFGVCWCRNRQPNAKLLEVLIPPTSTEQLGRDSLTLTLSDVLGEFGLVVEQLQLRGRTGHEQENDAVHFRRVVAGIDLGQQLIGHQAGQGGFADADVVKEAGLLF